MGFSRLIRAGLGRADPAFTQMMSFAHVLLTSTFLNQTATGRLTITIMAAGKRVLKAEIQQ